MDKFEFNVPRFTDFNLSTDSDDDEVEKYFDVDHEWDECHFKTSQTNNDEMKEEVVPTETGKQRTPKRPMEVLNTPRKTPVKTPRKSDWGFVRQFEGLTLTTPSRKSHPMETRQDMRLNTQPLELRHRKVVRISEKPTFIDCESLVRKRRSTYADEQPEKYICMAEAVERFHKATPARFHSKPRNTKFDGKFKMTGGLKTTIPVSPHLKVIHRNRPSHVLSREQLEEKEVEEMKKHQIKARPMNEKIFQPPKVDVSHRSNVTEIRPFNLTEFKKKIQAPQPTVMKFTARPVPKGLFKRNDVKNMSAPNLLRPVYEIPARYRVSATKATEKENKVLPPQPIRKGPITTVPFSFYERDKVQMKRKEEKLKQVLEEEKKTHEFHANPLPKFPPKPFQEKPTILPTVQHPFQLSADDKGKANKEKWEKKVEESKMLMKKAAEFKAKCPTVLSKKPFIPIKTEHECKPLDIHLNTEVRAKDRALYDLKVQMKQEELDELRKERKKELERIEEEEVAHLRKELVHKANPIKHYKEMSIRPANKPLTLPMSPKSIIEKKYL